MKRRIAFVIGGVLIIAVAVSAYFFFNSHNTPATQEALSDLTSQSLESFKGQFNRYSDRTRVILLLSPT